MKTWWALVGGRGKLRSKVKIFNFVPFSRFINFVCQRRKTAKNVGSGTQNIALIKQTEKIGSWWFSIFNNFLNANAQYIRGQIKVHAVRYALLMCLLLAAPTSTHGVFTSFSLSQYCCLQFWKKNKFGSVLAQTFLRVKGQAQITKGYFLWVDAIICNHWVATIWCTNKYPWIFTLFSISQYCCLHFWKNKVGSMLAQGFLRVKSQAKITKCYFLSVGAINFLSLSGRHLMSQQVPMAFLLLLVY